MWASARSHRATSLSPQWKRKISRSLVFALLILLMIFLVFPYYWTIVTTLKPSEEQFDRVPSFLPRNWTLSNYAWILTQKTFLRSLLNSVIVASTTAVVATALNSLSAYSLARYQYKGKQIVIAFLLGTQMMPGVLTIVPLFVIFSRLGLSNSRLGLILGFCTFSVPFSMLILRGFFDSLPPDLEEAAIIDGCSRLGAFVRVVVPLAMPGISTAALFVFVGAWNDLLFSMIISMDASTKTAAVVLSEMIATQYAATNWGGMIAEAAMMTFPVAIVFVFLQRYLIEGLTAGAIKG